MINYETDIHFFLFYAKISIKNARFMPENGSFSIHHFEVS